MAAFLPCLHAAFRLCTHIPGVSVPRFPPLSQPCPSTYGILTLPPPPPALLLIESTPGQSETCLSSFISKEAPTRAVPHDCPTQLALTAHPGVLAYSMAPPHPFHTRKFQAHFFFVVIYRSSPVTRPQVNYWFSTDAVSHVSWYTPGTSTGYHQTAWNPEGWEEACLACTIRVQCLSIKGKNKS